MSNEVKNNATVTDHTNEEVPQNPGTQEQQPEQPAADAPKSEEERAKEAAAAAGAAVAEEAKDGVCTKVVEHLKRNKWRYAIGAAVAATAVVAYKLLKKPAPAPEQLDALAAEVTEEFAG